RELELRPERDLLALLQQPGVLDRDVGRGAEDLALAARLGLLLGGVVDLLEHAGDREEEGGLERAEGREQLARVRLVTGAHPRVHVEDGDEAGEDVCRRDEEEGGGPRRLHDLVERLRGVAGQLDEVAVGEHAALRSPGGTRGVDEGGDVGADGEVPAALDLLVGDRRPLGGERVDRAQVQLPDLPEQRQVAAHLVDASEVLRRLDEEGDRAGVLEDPLDLRRRAGLVDRHHHRTGVEEGEVDEAPLVGGAGEEAHLLAGLDARGGEALRERDHRGLEVGGGDVAPSVALRDGEQRPVGSRLDALRKQVGDVRVGIGGDDRGDFKLDHGSSFGTGRARALVRV
ncbi:unnamed protein product, partial [Penicillium discolor]